ncbi:DUF3040 domain-containing protein [Arthrobacter sp. H14]|uniref:DUF3040 domain-containing protein n=1 Tax=Arthrobacter sp. H14 TaxID=1312959 RepID=UPI00047C1DD7|nr:DUF3040 domain-containing protein [Arthrobacter sp. H14]
MLSKKHERDWKELAARLKAEEPELAAAFSVPETSAAVRIVRVVLIVLAAVAVSALVVALIALELISVLFLVAGIVLLAQGWKWRGRTTR